MQRCAAISSYRLGRKRTRVEYVNGTLCTSNVCTVSRGDMHRRPQVVPIQLHYTVLRDNIISHRVRAAERKCILVAAPGKISGAALLLE